VSENVLTVTIDQTLKKNCMRVCHTEMKVWNFRLLKGELWIVRASSLLCVCLTGAVVKELAVGYKDG